MCVFSFPFCLSLSVYTATCAILIHMPTHVHTHMHPSRLYIDLIIDDRRRLQQRSFPFCVLHTLHQTRGACLCLSSLYSLHCHLFFWLLSVCVCVCSFDERIVSRSERCLDFFCSSENTAEAWQKRRWTFFPRLHCAILLDIHIHIYIYLWDNALLNANNGYNIFLFIYYLSVSR